MEKEKREGEITLTGQCSFNFFSFYGLFIFTLTGTIESGLPTLQLPQFGTFGSLGGNGTEMAADEEPTSLGTMISRFW